MLKFINMLCLAVLIFLQYQLWYGEHGLRHFNLLQQRLVQVSEDNALLVHRNARLTMEVDNLKQGLDWIEAYARRDFGMIKQGETFFQIVD